MSEVEERARVVAEARSWIGTPYHHRAKLKGVGVDCAQLPLCIYVRAGLMADFDTGEYPHDWHQHREEERYAGFVRQVCRELPSLDLVGPGDLILWKFGRAFSHGAIAVGLPQVLHASLKDGAVVMTDIDRDSELLNRPARYFSIWGR